MSPLIFKVLFKKEEVEAFIIAGDIKKKVEEAKFQRTGELFQQWPGFVLNLIGKENDSLTMNEIWELLKK